MTPYCNLRWGPMVKQLHNMVDCSGVLTCLCGKRVHDYIHVVNLADGHTAALKKLSDPKIGCEVYNLGTGKGTSVLEMVVAFEKASRKKGLHVMFVFVQRIPVVTAGRRPGDAKVVKTLH
ncbi:unnamed protein product [Lactuca saligna]|uniref:UDP-glucose 4-epimerase n=1 Tax=Lactuca saligna TaxID=75948 RepID=A0AA36EBS1_LACSI|nr:unnamed protein product [Lactuca saligna]